MCFAVAACVRSRSKFMNPAMLALTDNQLKSVMDAAANIDPDRRDVFLQRIGMMLTLKGRFDDRDVADTARLAACGLVQIRAIRPSGAAAPARADGRR